MNPILKIALLVIGIIALRPATECRTAPPQHDSLVLRLNFRQSDALLLKDYRGNDLAIATLTRLLDKNSVERISSICITGSASPEGNQHKNEILALERAKSLRNYIYWKSPTFDRTLVSIAANTDFCVAWLRAVERDTLVPRRDHILDILRSQASVATKWANIKLLKGDATAYTEQMIFPYLRNSVSCIVLLKPLTEQQAAKTPENPSPTDGTYTDNPCTVESEIPASDITDTPEPVSTPAITSPTPDQITSTSPLSDSTNSAQVSSLAIESSRLLLLPRKPLRVALKTNLLFDAATMLNLELEIPIGERWSVAGEVIVPWWLSNNKQHCLQLMSGNIEGKYWFGSRQNRPQLTGWFAGLYVGGGYYDLEWNRTGYQGEFFIALGMSGGYAHTINRRGTLRMEYTLGIGYMQTDYRKYEAKIGYDDVWHLYRRESGTYKWLGPTRLKISLVWMLDLKRKGVSK